MIEDYDDRSRYDDDGDDGDDDDDDDDDDDVGYLCWVHDGSWHYLIDRPLVLTDPHRLQWLHNDT